jgi:hypothetical protein
LLSYDSLSFVGTVFKRVCTVPENTVHSDVPGSWPDVERLFTAWGSSSGRGLGPAHHAAYLACVRGLPLPQEEDDRQQEEEEEREGEIERDATTHQRSTAVSEIGKMTSGFESDENYFRGFLHRYSFPYFLTRFLTDFFMYDTQISTENIYRVLIKQTGHKKESSYAHKNSIFLQFASREKVSD